MAFASHSMTFFQRLRRAARHLTRTALRIGTVLGLMAGTAMLAGCGAGSSDPELREAARAMRSMTGHSVLRRSCFYMAYPNGTPSAFVDYLFSPLGAAEWPPRDGRTAPGEELSPDQSVMREAMGREAEQARAAGMAVLPGSVKISRLERRYPDARELVLRPDDTEGVVRVEGYLPDESDPALETEWTLAPASPDQATRQLCRGKIDMGAGATP